MMRRHIAIAFRLVLVSTILFGLVYPLVLTGASHLLFQAQANGNLVRYNGRVVGSQLIGQTFSSPRYFHPRPSAAGSGYDAGASSGSNLGPTSRALADRVGTEVERLVKENPGLKRGNIPVDMVTASGSGLDPDISTANAYAQAGRVARSRGVSESRVRSLIAENTTGRQFGVLGEPRTNVLRLNIALDELQGSR